MTGQEYFSAIQSRFQEPAEQSGFGALRFYESKFEMKWAATKLKLYSFVSYAPHVTKEGIAAYTERCMQGALHIYKGLPRGFQNGVASFNVLVTNAADADALEFVCARPKKYFAAMQMPVIVDLAKGELYYYRKTPMWGAIYYGFFRKYIEEKFHV